MQYIIQENDTLWDLSRRFKVPLEQLLAQMPKHVQRDPRKLQPGMVIDDGRPTPLANKKQATEPRQKPQPLPAEWSGAVEPVAAVENLIGVGAGAKAIGALGKGLAGLITRKAATKQMAEEAATRTGNAAGQRLARNDESLYDYPAVLRREAHPGLYGPAADAKYAGQYVSNTTGLPRAVDLTEDQLMRMGIRNQHRNPALEEMFREVPPVSGLASTIKPGRAPDPADMATLFRHPRQASTPGAPVGPGGGNMLDDTPTLAQYLGATRNVPPPATAANLAALYKLVPQKDIAIGDIERLLLRYRKHMPNQ